MKNFLIFLTIVAICAIIFLNYFMAQFMFGDEVNELCSSEYETTSFLLSGEYRQCLNDKEFRKLLTERKAKEHEQWIEAWRAELKKRLPKLQMKMTEMMELIGLEKFYPIDQKLFNTLGLKIRAIESTDASNEKNRTDVKSEHEHDFSDIEKQVAAEKAFVKQIENGQIPSRLLRVTMSQCTFLSDQNEEGSDRDEFFCIDSDGGAHSFDGYRFRKYDLALGCLYFGAQVPIELFIEVQIDRLNPDIFFVDYEVLGMIIPPEVFSQCIDKPFARAKQK